MRTFQPRENIESREEKPSDETSNLLLDCFPANFVGLPAAWFFHDRESSQPE
jgi:hypothetical protein